MRLIQAQKGRERQNATVPNFCGFTLNTKKHPQRENLGRHEKTGLAGRQRKKEDLEEEAYTCEQYENDLPADRGNRSS